MRVGQVQLALALGALALGALALGAHQCVPSAGTCADQPGADTPVPTHWHRRPGAGVAACHEQGGGRACATHRASRGLNFVKGGVKKLQA